MRYGRGITAVALAIVLAAPAAAAAQGREERVEGTLASELSATLELAEVQLGEWMRRLGELLQATWSESRGAIVPGADGGTVEQSSRTLELPTAPQGDA